MSGEVENDSAKGTFVITIGGPVWTAPDEGYFWTKYPGSVPITKLPFAFSRRHGTRLPKPPEVHLVKTLSLHDGRISTLTIRSGSGFAEIDRQAVPEAATVEQAAFQLFFKRFPAASLAPPPSTFSSNVKPPTRLARVYIAPPHRQTNNRAAVSPSQGLLGRRQLPKFHILSLPTVYYDTLQRFTSGPGRGSEMANNVVLGLTWWRSVLLLPCSGCVLLLYESSNDSNPLFQQNSKLQQQASDLNAFKQQLEAGERQTSQLQFGCKNGSKLQQQAMAFKQQSAAAGNVFQQSTKLQQQASDLNAFKQQLEAAARQVTVWPYGQGYWRY
ncbi:hypothetical protein CONLIGDRAFT_685800 [Coniochaeta ligniaria NRRL 30616]|uniref:Uncharacterized protein n=1 Tax=Coniochaeta ligniaria NRRL 30616 TaxID=1408157 RepID=A0A1J7I9P2_9PEZI|nr:hypothetical protein CONLIGDRAFT_685800 [Coniochaeta ligniaria NRRL 30616]